MLTPVAATCTGILNFCINVNTDGTNIYRNPELYVYMFAELIATCTEPEL
jgi:hypothetical protein